jgi:hypothetical protein
MGGPREADADQFAALVQRYGFESRPETIPELLQRFGLRMGEPLSGGWTPLTLAAFGDDRRGSASRLLWLCPSGNLNSNTTNARPLRYTCGCSGLRV